MVLLVMVELQAWLRAARERTALGVDDRSGRGGRPGAYDVRCDDGGDHRVSVATGLRVDYRR
jgi:hypothetical protein